jgi:nickel-dependent lactate racemase
MPTVDKAIVPDDNVVIALDRDTPGAEYLVMAVWPYLEKRGITADRVTIIQPASLFAGNSDDPRRLLPPDVQEKVTFKVHDPTAENSCSYLATSSSGDRIYLARELVEADFVLPIGVAGFDPLLGYRGTHSVLYPGLSSLEAIGKTIGQGHLELSPEDQRPLRQLVDEIAWLMGIQFVVQAINADEGGVLDVVAGSGEAVFVRCRELLNDHWMISMPSRVDTVVVAVPADAGGHSWNQIGSALAAARQIVDNQGRIVVLSQLDQEPGFGLKMLSRFEDPLDAIKPLRVESPPDLTCATQIANTASWARIFMLSQLDDLVVEDLFMHPLEDASEVEQILRASESSALIGAAQNAFGIVDG